ncbi:hypothetical protein BT67DRAFT_435260 [Trichocladium antarcticum]|uniref:Uncharacterized protein n=1 Tax=Trichocladium antarcticum TaxID=1450529 RepID=A0AAN6UHU6_9PEZI|nr:hypothetical protein BT67DRAFT_435260 [Trichocladium antarcticum]
MAQYPPAQEWPDWCRVSCHGPYLVKVAFLDSLPRFMRKHGSSILDQVDNIRLRRLSHYKCCTDWNHEFIRADLVDDESNKPLVMVWERDLPLTGAKAEKQRGLRVKSGLPCQSIDRVTYITEDDFLDFVKLKGAYPLRTADFPTPGPNILQLASVLETHSLSFPTYLLAEIGKANVSVEGKPVQKRGVWSWLNVDCVAYSGVTRRSLKDDTYQQLLVQMQGELVAKYDGAQKKASSQEELSTEERQAIEQNGWNVAQFLRMIQDMPTHQTLFDDSTARAREVRELLEKIQFGQEEQEATAKREAEAKQCAEIERVLVEQEDKWRRAISEARERLERVQQGRERAEQEREQERARADLAERRAEQERERAEQERERADNLAMEIAKLRLFVSSTYREG